MSVLVPVLFVVLLWWLSTVVLLYRCGRDSTTYRATFYGTAVVAVIGVFLIWLSRGQTGDTGVYLGFAGALAVWAFHEASYLLGFITGPRPEACPPGKSLAQRFWYGLQASLFHELAIVLTAMAIAAICWDAPNKIGLWTFVVLWLMRWSVKVNIFLGVRNLHHEFWPSHLQYLQSYARTRVMNAWFPVSIFAASVVAYFLVVTAGDAGASQQTSLVLLLTILALAMLEHILLMLPVPDEILWRAGMRSRESTS